MGTQRCLPRSARCVPLRSLPPRCVLVCFYNKDNSAASSCFSSLCLAGGTNASPLLLHTVWPFGRRLRGPLGCISCCKYPAKMLELRRKSMVWGFERKDQGSGSVWLIMKSLVNRFTTLSSPFLLLVKPILKDIYLPQRVVLRFNWLTSGNLQSKFGFKAACTLD